MASQWETKFKIMETLQIRDPDTKKLLGEITREKLRLRVVQLEQSMSIARTYETYEIKGTPLLGFPELQRTEVKRIRTRSDSSDSVLVEIGDIAIELTDDES